MAKKNRRKIHTPRPGQQMMPHLNMGFLNAATVKPIDYKSAQIIAVGAGGIGSYMIQHIGRIMRVLYQSDKGVHLTIVDPDIVEEKNIGRQLFCDAEVGVPKAEALARRYGHAWGLNCSSYVGNYDDSLLVGAELTLLVGCVDKAPGRIALNETLQHNSGLDRPKIFWLDCGNLEDTGRVFFGSAFQFEDLHGAFPDEKSCVALPSPAMQDPGMLIPGPDELADGAMSCADLAAANLQSLNINAAVAVQAADMLTRFLVTGDLRRFACQVNVEAGSVTSDYVTPENVARVIRKPVSFLQERAEAAFA